jgi:hypothetical protein
MGWAEKREGYWRGRYRLASGKLRTVCDAAGRVIRFRTKREAERAANDAETKARNAGRRHDPAAGRLPFPAFVSRWYASLDLAPSTMQNYRRHIEEHLLPAFETFTVAEMEKADVTEWERK